MLVTSIAANMTLTIYNVVHSLFKISAVVRMALAHKMYHSDEQQIARRLLRRILQFIGKWFSLNNFVVFKYS